MQPEEAMARAPSTGPVRLAAGGSGPALAGPREADPWGASRWVYTRSRAPDRYLGQRALNLMLSWSITFLVIALIAGVLGMGVASSVAANIAWILFAVFLVLFALSLISGRHGPRPLT